MITSFSIIWGTRHIQYPQLSVYVACALRQLKGMGIKPRDRVALCASTSVEYVIVLLALWQLQALAAPINPDWPQKNIDAYLATINTRHLLRAIDIQRIVCFDARHPVVSTDFLKDFNQDQEITIVATSGSTGVAKAAVHTWGNYFFSAKGSDTVIALRSTDRWLLSLPLYHVSGLAILTRCLVAGAAVVIVEDKDMMRSIECGHVTHLSVVATQLRRVLLQASYHPILRSLKAILLGGSAIPPILMDEALNAGLNIYASYGLTEMSSQVATGKLTHGHQSCLRVLPYRQLCIAFDGEVLVKGEVLFKGYIIGSHVSLPKDQHTDGWFRTGDMGSLDKEGCLRLTGRKDAMFISGGENIHPEEIEQAVLSIAGIAQVIVVPRADAEFGQRPVAYLQYAKEPLDTETLIQCLQTLLPRFKIPTAFLPWPKDVADTGIKISRKAFLC